MSKSKRLLELMMTVNRKRRFKVQELADEFGVSTRTILRDLQELSEIGVPLYSEVGPHGGYQVLKERVLPPIAFTEDEAVAIFFASHALRHYRFLPFETESATALNKFYYYMPSDVRDRIDQMKNRFDLVTPTRQIESPFLKILLEGAVDQKVILIAYEAQEGVSDRKIQPIGIYASNGLWYCPAYCFLRKDFRVFRCDRMHAAQIDTSETEPVDLRDIHLGNRETVGHMEQAMIPMSAYLTKEGVTACESEVWSSSKLRIHEDGTGSLNGAIPKSDIPFYAKFFIGLGNDVKVEQPQELIETIKRMLREILDYYG
ncbi:YafY family transcriptional regulator [Paenibacillus sp. HWE-109]|uniref:helix-turn-helix transcriptional regulator n=1 Tax=Paenibacillus sp. HWE-109 TaxID=1306526 RepID=UPI001EE12D94|nr:YafY family protein [Paenibacillus sp. HWE-109]UKS27147.1 YafY family transcriptional regulator [Paenibacillus sp. HWE-109]